MDTRTGQIHHFENEEELKKAQESNPHLKEVALNKDCNDCPAYSSKWGCTGGNRKERREKYKCRVTKIKQ